MPKETALQTTVTRLFRGRPHEPSWPHGQALAPNHLLTVRSHVPGEVVALAEVLVANGAREGLCSQPLRIQVSPLMLLFVVRSHVEDQVGGQAERQVALGTPVLGGQAQGGECRGQQGPRVGGGGRWGHGDLDRGMLEPQRGGAQESAAERSIWWHRLQVPKITQKFGVGKSTPASDINCVDESQQLSLGICRFTHLKDTGWSQSPCWTPGWLAEGTSLLPAGSTGPHRDTGAAS